MVSYDSWKSTNPWWESGPEPVNCAGCGEPVEDGLAASGDLCIQCLEVEVESNCAMLRDF